MKCYHLLGLLLVALGLQRAVAAVEGETSAQDRRFKVICHFDGKREAKEALRAAQAAWPLAAEFYGVERNEVPDKRMEIHLFRTMEDYARTEAQITYGQFRHSGAFASYKTKAAYVAVQPHCSDEVLRRYGLPLLTRVQIAHEACHVVSYTFTKHFQRHPLWYAEGFATWVSNKVLVGEGSGPGLAADPYASKMMRDVQLLFEAGKLPSAGHLLEGQISNGYYVRYALWWTFFGVLMEGPYRKRFLELSREANGVPSIQAFLRQKLPEVAGGMKRLDDAFRKRAGALKPFWEERLRSLEITPHGWLHRAFASSPAFVWRVDHPGDSPYSFEGTVTLLPGGNPTARLLLANTKEAYLSLDIIAGWGVRLYRHDWRSYSREEIASAASGGCRVDVPIRLKVEVGAGKVTVRLNGENLLDASLDKHPMSGAWGLGLDSGAAALWRLRSYPGARIPTRTGPGSLPNDVGKLSAIVRTRAGKQEAIDAVRALGRMGGDALPALAAMIPLHARKHPEIARAAALELGAAEGPEPLRLLRKRYRPSFPPAVRGAILSVLARDYPKDAEWIHAALLEAGLPDKPAILIESLDRGLASKMLRQCLTVLEIAPLAYHELVARGEAMNPSELTVVARAEAPRGISMDYARELQRRLAKGTGWSLLQAMASLVKDDDPAIRDGATTLFMTVSGKDMVSDPDVWRSWIEARRDRYGIPDEVSAGRVAAAVLRGVEFLRRRILAHGYCVINRENDTGPNAYGVAGSTGLAVLALRAAGVKKDDAAIRRALDGTLLVRNLHGQLVLSENIASQNYQAAILTMALAAVDREKYRYKIQTLANRIAAGQLPSGQWTYSTGSEYGKGPEYDDSRRFVGDASNTQYALLGLRAALKAGAEVDPGVWRRAMTMYLEGQDPWGGWGYTHTPFSGVERSMTAAGIAGVVICLEGLYGDKAAGRIAASGAIRRGLIRQGQLLIGWKWRGMENYAFYGVERACVLTGTRFFNNYDWYREGAKDLLRRQRGDGSWLGKSPGRGPGNFEYGPYIDTAYALLYLKRATTVVDGVKSGGQVRCPKGPNQIRGHWPWRWPRPLPEEKE